MVTKNMNRSLLMIGLVFSLLVVAPASEGQDLANATSDEAAATQTCSSETLKGTYGFIVQGTAVAQLPGFPPPPILVVTSGIVTYDGAGNNWGQSTNNLNGLVTTTGTFSGTQTVNADCTFSGQHKGTSGSVTHFVGTITGSGMSQEIHFIITDPGRVAYGTDYRIPPGGCSLSSLAGSYAFRSQGTITANTPSSLFARVGIVTSDGRGNFEGSSTIALNGATVTETFTGTYAVDANCTVSLEISSSVFGVIHELGRITREGRSQEVVLIVTDHGYVVTEAMRKQ